MIKAKALQPSGCVAFIAPASGLAAHVTHRLLQGKKYFEENGFQVKMYPTSQKSEHIISSDKPEARAKDLMDAFLDDSVHAIICTIGGNTSHQLIEYLDFEKIRKHPKIFVGYSDITSLHLAIYEKSKLITFYGPSVICQFGEFPKPYEYTEKNFFQSVGSFKNEIIPILPSKEWTDDKSINWFTQMDKTHTRKLKPNEGYIWLRNGIATGCIMGGCLPVLMNLRGTTYYPDLKNCILLLETPEGDKFDEPLSLANVDCILGSLRLDGTFNMIQGLVFGRGFQYSEEDITKLHTLILENTRDYTFPILYGVDVGHTDPMLTVPLGIEVTINSEKNSFTFNESGVID